MKSDLVAVPTREECRASALLDQPTKSLASGASSPANVSLSIERLRAKASYNEAYREANQHKAELGVKRLKMYEDELEIKRIEAQARQDEVKAGVLEELYNDLRLDLKMQGRGMTLMR